MSVLCSWILRQVNKTVLCPQSLPEAHIPSYAGSLHLKKSLVSALYRVIQDPNNEVKHRGHTGLNIAVLAEGTLSVLTHAAVPAGNEQETGWVECLQKCTWRLHMHTKTQMLCVPWECHKQEQFQQHYLWSGVLYIEHIHTHSCESTTSAAFCKSGIFSDAKTFFFLLPLIVTSQCFIGDLRAHVLSEGKGLRPQFLYDLTWLSHLYFQLCCITSLMIRQRVFVHLL